LENLNDGEDIKRAWENMTENIKTSDKQTRSVEIKAALTMI